MALSTYTDGNRFLDNDKLSFADASDYSMDEIPADRLITAVLFEVFGDVVNTWDIDPTPPDIEPPDIIIDISGMLAASYLYRRMYSEETTSAPYYADQLEARAMALLTKIRSGEIGLADEAYTSSTQMSDANFWPNDQTVDDCGNPVRLFTMQDIY